MELRVCYLYNWPTKTHQKDNNNKKKKNTMFVSNNNKYNNHGTRLSCKTQNAHKNEKRFQTIRTLVGRSMDRRRERARLDIELVVGRNGRRSAYTKGIHCVYLNGLHSSPAQRTVFSAVVAGPLCVFSNVDNVVAQNAFIRAWAQLTRGNLFV